MADSIICARHGRTSKLFKGFCGEARAGIDRGRESPDRVALRVALEIPDDLCGRPGLPECATCHHPAHPGVKCSTMLDHDGPSGTAWCQCEAIAS